MVDIIECYVGEFFRLYGRKYKCKYCETCFENYRIIYYYNHVKLKKQLASFIILRHLLGI